MSWKSEEGVCSRCGKTGKLHPSFGKKICDSCKDSRPGVSTGNAGLRQDDQGVMIFSEGLQLRRVPKSDALFGKLFFSHYPGSKGIPGRSLCYLVEYNGEVAGIIGFNSPPRNYGVFNEYFGKDMENSFLINNVFRLTNNEKNLATRVMKIARTTAKRDYETRFPEKLLGIVTFVEPPRTGALYKADNWDQLGMSAGKRMKRDSVTWEKVFTEGEKKLIFGYRYKK